MAKVRSKGNVSTEAAAEAVLRLNRVRGWVKHPDDVLGHPDFYFRSSKLALFIDGCFWHACPICGRIPKSRTEFWSKKIDENRRRDNRVRKKLRTEGIHVVRVWEHQVQTLGWVNRVNRLIPVGMRASH
jgi:DNA mismatch endonuclease (patch repair protein)